MEQESIDKYEDIISQVLENNYAIVDNFFDLNLLKELRSHLIEFYNQNKFKQAGIGKSHQEKIETRIRGDFIQWIDDKNANDKEQNFFKQIDQLIDYLNKTCYLGISSKEFHYAVYPPGCFYKRHLDIFEKDKKRRWSMVLYLNEIWQSSYGGDLVIYKKEDHTEKAIHILPEFGKLVLFESSILEHEVLPVIKEKRLSITGWLKTR